MNDIRAAVWLKPGHWTERISRLGFLADWSEPYLKSSWKSSDIRRCPCWILLPMQLDWNCNHVFKRKPIPLKLIAECCCNVLVCSILSACIWADHWCSDRLDNTGQAGFCHKILWWYCSITYSLKVWALLRRKMKVLLNGDWYSTTWTC